MKPGDVITVQYPTGVSLSWAVASILLGALGVESVIELVPVDQRPSGHGSTLVPAPLLDALVGHGRIIVQEMETE